MPIYVDASEGRQRSNTPVIAAADYVNGLEAATGADVMVSWLNLSFDSLDEHLKQGMLFQIKIGHDLIASMQDERLAFSLAKMQVAVKNSWQRWLVYTGSYRESATGETLLNGVPTGLSWASFDGQLAAWGEGGGVVHNLERPDQLARFLDKRLERLQKYLTSGSREVYPVLHFPAEEGTGFLRQLKPVTDFRVMLTALPGVGPIGAQRLWEFYNKNPAAILAWLTDPAALKVTPRPDGFGPKTLERIRDYLKLNPTDKINLKPGQ